MKHTEADAPAQSAYDVEALMSQAQIFASTWSLAGGRFDSGDGFEQAENAKNELRRMLNAALAAQPAAQGDAKDAQRYRLLRNIGGKSWTDITTGGIAKNELYDLVVDAAILANKVAQQ